MRIHMDSIQSMVRVAIDYDVPVAMPDGTVLATDVYRPAAPGRYPVILVRTPYDKLQMPPAMHIVAGFDALASARNGYVVAIQDVRGTFGSQGVFYAFRNETADGPAAVAWAQAQPWSNGSVAMAGHSYMGVAQLMAATQSPPGLKAIVPAIAGAEGYELHYQGGALRLSDTLGWYASMTYADVLRRERLGEDVAVAREALEALLAELPAALRQLPLSELPARTPWLSNFADVIAHPDRDDYWLATAVNERYGSIGVPALHVAGWNDVLLKGSLENYVGLRTGAATEDARDSQRLIVTPWAHGFAGETVGELWFGPQANPVSADLARYVSEFLGAYLNGGPPPDAARVRIFVMGADRWREEEDWPLARAQHTRWYLSAPGRLARDSPGDEPPDTFLYDPRDPVPTLTSPDPSTDGPRDRRMLQQREDVLVYTSAVL